MHEPRACTPLSTKQANTVPAVLYVQCENKNMHVSRILFQTFLLLHLSSVSPNAGTLAKLKNVLSVGVWWRR